MSDYYEELSIDHVVKPVRDTDAVHYDEITQVVLDVLSDSTIREALLNQFHPIGSYYLTDRNVNPGTFLGGTWVAVEGRVLLGASAKYPVNSTGGYEDAVVIEHNHDASVTVAEGGAHTHPISGTAASAGSHSHGLSGKFSGGSGGKLDRYVRSSGRKDSTPSTDGAGTHTHSLSGTATSAGAHTHSANAVVNDTGISGTGRNMMPYKAAYIWVRTA